MARHLYSPQVEGPVFAYVLTGEVLTASRLVGMGTESDSWDLSALVPDSDALDITSTLEPCPLLAARRTTGGALRITVLKSIALDASREECFPEWKEVPIDGRF